MSAAGPTSCCLTLPEVREQIADGALSIVTFDVFDTLVWRGVATPSDVFAALGHRLHEAGLLPDHYDPQEFRIARMTAENMARAAAYRARQTLECTVEEIWHELKERLQVDATVEQLVEHEMVVERASLHVHHAAYNVLRDAVTNGATVALVSDIYLSGQQLRTLLVDVGLVLDDVQVFTSADHRRCKHDGLLADVWRQLGGSRHSAHVGDNPISDIEAAQAAGGSACYVGAADSTHAIRDIDVYWAAMSTTLGSDAARQATVRETYARHPARRNDAAFQFGVDVVGPVMVGYVEWLNNRCRELGADQLYCMWREGARIESLLNTVCDTPVSTVPLHVSRWAVVRAAVFSATPDELFRALSRRSGLSAQHVADAFDLDPAAVASVMGGARLPFEQQMHGCSLLSSSPLAQAIVDASSQRRSELVAYLTRTLDTTEQPLVLCDVGWGGTIQAALTEVLRSVGIDRPVHGLYTMVSPPGQERSSFGAQLESYLPMVNSGQPGASSAWSVLRHPEFLERMNMPPVGTVYGYTESGEPVRQPDSEVVVGESLTTSQLGVDAFASAYVELADPVHRATLRRPEWAGAAAQAYAQVVTRPTEQLARRLATWSHDDVAGKAPEPLISDEFIRWAPYLNPADASQITMRDTYWVAGAASIAGPDVSLGLELIANGTSPELVAPVSPLGQARIAVFPVGSDLASAQLERIPHLNSSGWLLMRLRTVADGVRSVRIDVASEAAWVDVGDVAVVAQTDSGTETIVDGVDALATHDWEAGDWTGRGRAYVGQGGHLNIEFPTQLAPDVTAVSVTIAYRLWPVAQREASLRINTLAARGLAHRVGRAVERRLLGRSR